MTVLSDPNADARSLMNRRPCVCDGAASGIVCKHFWGLDQRFHAANADAVRRGDIRRNCTMVDGFMLEFTEPEKPTFCNRYTPRKTPGLVAITKRVARAAVGLKPKAGAGYEPYDVDFDSFKPMTPEEIEALRTAMPDRPIQWQHGMDPSRMNAFDIANSPPINMLAPGEKPKGLELSAETEAALGGIFDRPSPTAPTASAEGGIFDTPTKDET